MSLDVKHLTESFICDWLTGQVPGHKFLPFTGTGMNDDALEPPFTVIATSNTEKRFAQFDIWHITGTAQIITHSDEAASEEHSNLVRQINNALRDIAATVSDNLTFHGLNITDVRESTDETGQAHASIIGWVAGVTG